MRKPSQPQGTGTASTMATSADSQLHGQAVDERIETQNVVNAQSGRSGYSVTSSVGTEFAREFIPARQRESDRVQQVMKSFIKGMLKTREIMVLAVDGQLRLCNCQMDRKLKTLTIEMNRSERKVALSDVDEVFQGVEPKDIDTPLDESCCTLMLRTGECITFSFDNVEERETFAMCFQILVDGLH
jgi:hypothetical protein